LIRIGGEPVEPADADIVEVERNVYSVLADGASYEAYVDGNEVTIGGVRVGFEVDDPRKFQRSAENTAAQGSASIKSAMPGKVVRVLVSVGDEVKAGQGILVIEAMKMQNELKSPRDGRVMAIEAKEDDRVSADTILARIE